MPQRPRLAYTASLARQGAAALVLSLCAAQASAAYNAAYCQSVANTLNIHWEAVSGPFAPCAGIEFTDATVADAAGGTVSMIGMSVSVGGGIGFVGLVTPHMIRLIVGANHRRTLPACLYGGAIFLLLADLISRTILAPAVLPVGVVTSIIGAAAFLVIFLRTKRRERA